MSAKKNSSIKKVSSNEFEVPDLKKRIGRKMENHENKAFNDNKLCKHLGCRCIANSTDFEHYQDHSNPNKNHASTNKQKRLKNDVSNICLTLLTFFIMDGEKNMEKNLNLLFQQSMNFLNRQRGPDEIMVYVFYPIYTTFFQAIRRKLEKELNYSVPFIYDQRSTFADRGYWFFDDLNEKICTNTKYCKNALAGIVSTWKKVLNVFSFNWKMQTGSLVANWNYLMMLCSEKYPLQTTTKMWAPNNKFFVASCWMSVNAHGLFELIQTITEEISMLPFEGIYLNDFIGYLGYSSTFDLSSLGKNEYMYNTRNLHPIYGMDTWMHDKGWRQCNYLATYQKWVKHASNLDQGKPKGKCIMGRNHVSS